MRGSFKVAVGKLIDAEFGGHNADDRYCVGCRERFPRRSALCPRCGGAMRIVAFVTEPAVVRRILAHLERRGIEARAGPWAGVGAAPG